MRKIIFLLLLASVGRGQTILDNEKTAWIARDGCLLDGCEEGMNESRAMGLILNGNYNAHKAEIDAFLNGLPTSFAWFDGARGSAPTAMEFVYWFNGQFDNSVRNNLIAALDDLPSDDYYWAQAWNNGQVNCVAVRYIMATKLAGTETCQYGPGADGFNTPATFTWDGTTYTAGSTYNTEELCRDWLYTFMRRFIDGDYLHGEMRSETYGYHFLNTLIMLADDRMVSDATMRARAQMTADLFLLEHGMASNGHHLSAPLGRTYLSSHLSGSFFFFPFEYFGGPHPTHYGHNAACFVSQYRPPSVVEDAGNYSDESNSFVHIVKTSMQKSYSYITKLFTMGTALGSGRSWALEINSNNLGPYPQARPGFNFRLWMNNNPDDLNAGANPGDYESNMGQDGNQWKDAIFVNAAGLILHEALANNSWDATEGSLTNWRFCQENGVAVAMTIQSGSFGAIEVSRLGIDEPNYAAFKAKFGSNPYDATKAHFVDENTYKSRNGFFITDSSGSTWVKEGSGAFVKIDNNYPRLEVIDITNPASPTYIITNPASREFVVSRNGLTINYDFNGWATTGDTGNPTDTDPPGAPVNFRISQ